MTSFFKKVNDLAGGAHCNLPETDILQTAYLRVTTLLDALMNVQYPQPIPKWKENVRTFSIANIHHDHLAQLLRVSSIPPWPPPIPTLRSMRENWVALKNGYPGIAIGPRPNDVFSSIGDDFTGGGTPGNGVRRRTEGRSRTR